MRKLINRILYRRNIYKKEKLPYNMRAMLSYMQETGKNAMSQLFEQETTIFLDSLQENCKDTSKSYGVY